MWNFVPDRPRLGVMPVSPESRGLPEAMVCGGLTLLGFCILLFAVTRLNPDR